MSASGKHPPPTIHPTSSQRYRVAIFIIGVVLAWGIPYLCLPRFIPSPTHGHILLLPHHQVHHHRDARPSRSSSSENNDPTTTPTLRQMLNDPEGFSLAAAPAFFGFYGYFGMLDAWQDDLGESVLSKGRIHALAGASAGAMTAILISLGITPQAAADFATNITLDQIADFPGFFSLFRGHKFEQRMQSFLQSHVHPPQHSLTMQDAHIPVAVTGFDLQSMRGKILTRGSMARAARASATFPFLFQPVDWNDEHGLSSWLIDGGIWDPVGMQGLTALIQSDQNDPTLQHSRRHRVVNLKVGSFLWGVCPGPSTLAFPAEVISISVQNLPQPGPWALQKGVIAYEAARKAMLASLDIPLYRGKEDYHYELHIDASSF